MLAKHFGNYVILHTDGAEAYAAAIQKLKDEGCTVLHDSVIHSQGQYTAFGRHDVTGTDWEGCDMAVPNEQGEVRIRVIKGSQKAEGLWRHLKHGRAGLPMEVRSDDQRLDLYVQSLAWRSQTCGCPYRDTLRMCRAFRRLPYESKSYVFEYGLKTKGSKNICLDKPPVEYCQWHLKGAEEDDEDDEEDPNEEGH